MVSEADWERMALDRLADASLGAEARPGDRTRHRRRRASWDDSCSGPLLAAMRGSTRRCRPSTCSRPSPRSSRQVPGRDRREPPDPRILVDGYRGISYIDSDGTEQNPTIRLVSHRPEDNDWLAVNQVTVRSGRSSAASTSCSTATACRWSIIELKKAGSKHADSRPRTPSCDLPAGVPDGVPVLRAHDRQRRDHRQVRHAVHPAQPLLAVERRRRRASRQARRRLATTGIGVELELPSTGSTTRSGSSRCAQLRRVRRGCRRLASGSPSRTSTSRSPRPSATTVEAVTSNGKAGVVWHTQGSGKSMEMELYANLVVRHPKLHNPTVVVITDRNELDGQLYETFDRSPPAAREPRSRCHPRRAAGRAADRTTGGIYFTTLQKFGRTKDERDAGPTTRCCPTGATSS